MTEKEEVISYSKLINKESRKEVRERERKKLPQSWQDLGYKSIL